MCNPTFAQLKLVSSTVEKSDTAYGQVIFENSLKYWIDSKLENDSIVLNVSNFFKNENSRKINLPFLPITFSSSVKGKNEASFPVFGWNANGGWEVIFFDFKNSKTTKQLSLPDFSFISDVAFNNKNYYIAGTDKNDMPLLQVINDNMVLLKILNFKFQMKGEVSSIILIKNKIFAITNYNNATSDLRSVESDNSLILIKSFAGGATTGLGYKDGGFVITYISDNKVFVEKFDAQIRSLWRTPLYSLLGPSTIKNKLLHIPLGLGFVGGLNSHLNVIRLNESGQIINVSIDNEHEFLIPPIGMYSAAVEGNLIHIRGQARRAKNPESIGKITTFHFVENSKQ